MKNLLALFALVVGLLVVSWGDVDAAPPNNRPPNNRPPNNRPPNNRPPNNRPPIVVPPVVVVPSKNTNTNIGINRNTNVGINKNVNTNVGINKNAATAINQNKINNDINIKLNLSKNSKGNTNSNNKGFGNPGWNGGYGWPFDGGYSPYSQSYSPYSQSYSPYNQPYAPPGYSYSPTGGAYAPSFTNNPTYNFGGYGGNPYGSDTNFLPNPNLNGFNTANNADTALITLELPSEEAEVWLNGAKTPQKGLVRKYVTPPLQKNKIYNYEIKVQWPVEKGRPLGAKIKYTTTLQFKAGDDISHTVPEEGDGKVALPMPKVELQPQDEERLMNQRLSWAKELLREGIREKAKERLKEIINKSPDSPAGQEAKALLDKIQ